MPTPTGSLQWCEANGIRMRGHCIFWDVDQYVQDWVKALDDAALRQAVERRAKEVTARYAGRISEYDVNNEMLHGHYYEKRLGPGHRAADVPLGARGRPRRATLRERLRRPHRRPNLASLREPDPGACSTLARPSAASVARRTSAGRLTSAKVKESLDRLARFDLPIRITEFDIGHRRRAGEGAAPARSSTPPASRTRPWTAS